MEYPCDFGQIMLLILFVLQSEDVKQIFFNNKNAITEFCPM